MSEEDPLVDKAYGDLQADAIKKALKENDVDNAADLNEKLGPDEALKELQEKQDQIVKNN